MAHPLPSSSPQLHCSLCLFPVPQVAKTAQIDPQFDPDAPADVQDLRELVAYLHRQLNRIWTYPRVATDVKLERERDAGLAAEVQRISDGERRESRVAASELMAAADATRDAAVLGSGIGSLLRTCEPYPAWRSLRVLNQSLDEGPWPLPYDVDTLAPMWLHQPNLPRRPVPSLESTGVCARGSGGVRGQGHGAGWGPRGRGRGGGGAQVRCARRVPLGL